MSLAEDLPELAANVKEVVASSNVDSVALPRTDNNAASTPSLAESDRRSNANSSSSVKLPKWMKLSEYDMKSILYPILISIQRKARSR
jgi:hypothetical protein